ncbi:COG1470 family protein [Methanolobus profundi]|nr:hypothetical protein [Methanolobus profundi]
MISIKHMIIGVTFCLILASSYASADWSSVCVKNQITGKVVYPGDIVEFPITIEKGYNGTDDSWCTMLVKSKPEGWTAGFYEDNDQITNIFFPEDESDPVDVVLKVKTPQNVSDGIYSIWVDIKPDDGDIISREFAITVDTKAEPNIEIYSSTPGIETRSNDPVKYLLTLENKYDHRITVNLDTIGKSENLSVEFLQEIDDEEFRLKTLSLAANSQYDILMGVKPSINLTDGTYSFKVQAVPENGGNGVSLNLNLIINNNLETEEMLTISQSTSSLVLNPGSSKEIYVTLRNNGDETLTNIDLKVQDVTGITAEVRSFGTIDELEPGESWDTSIEITARADASPGTKDLLMRAVSDDAQSQDGRVEIIVEKSDSGGFIGIGMVVVSILLLIVIVRKFGRR